jgi:hypothetical protein
MNWADIYRTFRQADQRLGCSRNTTVKTFSDLLQKLVNDDAVLVQDVDTILAINARLAQANQDLTDANLKKIADEQTRVAAGAAITAELKANGPRFVGPADDGTIAIYVLNTDASGYQIFTAKPPTAPAADPPTE